MRTLSVATVFSALAGFLVLYIAARALGSGLYDSFNAYWSLFFALGGVVDGVMQETTRGVSAARETSRPGTARPWRLAIALALVLLVLGGTAACWIYVLVPNPPAVAVPMLAMGLASYVFQSLLSGLLSGTKRWGTFARLLIADNGLRILIGALGWSMGWGLWVYLLVTVVGTSSWLLVLVLEPQARSACHAPVDVSLRQFTRRVGSAMLATGSTAALITGFPMLIQATASPQVGATLTVSGIMMAVTLTRAPILVPLQRFQSALIVRFVDAQSHLLRALQLPLLGVLGVGLLGAGAAWAVGPWILRWLFDPGFAVPGLILAILTFASSCTGCLMITGTAALATERYAAYVIGWLTASAVAFGILLAVPSLAAGVCSALILGPVAGGLIHLGALCRAARPSARRVSGYHHPLP